MGGAVKRNRYSRSCLHVGSNMAQIPSSAASAPITHTKYSRNCHGWYTDHDGIESTDHTMRLLRQIHNRVHREKWEEDVPSMRSQHAPMRMRLRSEGTET